MCRSAGSTVERQDWTSEQLAKIKQVSYRILPNTPLESPTRAFTLPEAFDLRFYSRSPQALAIDSADVRLTVADAKGRAGAARSLRLRLEPWSSHALTYPLTRTRERPLTPTGTRHYMTRLWRMPEIA